MVEENETVAGDTTTENENTDAQGTTADNATDSTDATEGSENTGESTVSADELQKQIETLEKEKQKVEMERNLLKNKQEEERKKQLEDEGNWKQLAEEREAELQRLQQEREAESAYKEAEKLRRRFIEEYPDEKVRKAAEALVDKNPSNLSWGDVQTEDEAKQAIFSQMDAIKETLGIISSEQENQDTQPQVHANNPATTMPPELNKYANMSSDEMRKVLASEGLIGESR